MYHITHDLPGEKKKKKKKLSSKSSAGHPDLFPVPDRMLDSLLVYREGVLFSSLFVRRPASGGCFMPGMIKLQSHDIIMLLLFYYDCSVPCRLGQN